MPDKLKRGRLGLIEQQFIKEKAGRMPVEMIAAELNRDVVTIRTWIEENLAIDVNEGKPLVDKSIRNELRASPEWEELRGQFLETELRLFEHKYSRLMSQFKADVLPTEETQIFLLIKFEILMDRNLKGRQRALQDVQRLETELDKEYSKHDEDNPMDDDTKNRVINLENQLVSARDAEQSKTSEYVKLSEKHSAIMKDLKATRDQRISKIENAKGSFIGLLRWLSDEEIRKAEGEDIALMNFAAEKEVSRLAQPHRYVDDNIDRPLLTPEIIEEDSDEENNSVG